MIAVKPAIVPSALSPAQRLLMPNLFLIGAGKAGTTSLHTYLSAHPEITGSSEKEPSFFADIDELSRHQLMEAMRPEANDLDAYLGLFRGGEGTRYRLESSPSYTCFPEFTGIPERIANASPDARILFLVRNPVDRAISHYWQNRKILKEDRPLAEALAGDSLYTWCSDYKRQLDRYRPYFEDRIVIVTAEDLRDDPAMVLSTIFSFLDLAPIYVDTAALGQKNVTKDTTRAPRFPLVKTLRDTIVWNRVRARLPRPLVETVRRAAVKNVPRETEGEAEVRAALGARFAPQVRALDEAYGTALHPRWCVAAAPAA